MIYTTVTVTDHTGLETVFRNEWESQGAVNKYVSKWGTILDEGPYHWRIRIEVR